MGEFMRIMGLDYGAKTVGVAIRHSLSKRYGASDLLNSDRLLQESKAL